VEKRPGEVLFIPEYFFVDIAEIVFICQRGL
jgi:hypothetical protein